MPPCLIGAVRPAAGPWRLSQLSLTPDRRDGTWIRVRLHVFFVVRTVAELAQWFPLAELEPDSPLALAA